MKNAPAVWSVVVGLLGVASLPAAVAYADRSERVELLWAGVAVPVAALLGLVAVALARRGRRRAELTLTRRSGARWALLGRLLGTLALLLAGSGITALAVYVLLTYRGSS
jgi:hypothetical protein